MALNGEKWESTVMQNAEDGADEMRNGSVGVCASKRTRKCREECIVYKEASWHILIKDGIIKALFLSSNLGSA